MSIPITKAMATTKPIPNDDDNKGNEHLPVIDILSFCEQNQHLKKRELTPNEPSQNISLFKASSFGIDGSFPPRVSSWSRKTMSCRVPKASRTRWSRTKSECSLVREEIQQIENPRSGYSSPCFQASSTPVRCRHLSYTPGSYQQSSPGVLGEQNIVISKANLNKRPNKKHMRIKTDANGNITSISESDPRRPIDFRRTIDLDTSTSHSRQTAQDRESSQSKVWFFRPDNSYPDNYHDELMSSYNNIIASGERDEETDEQYFPSLAPVKKIDIKLPC